MIFKTSSQTMINCAVVVVLIVMAATPLMARDKKRQTPAPVPEVRPRQDTSQLVWPGPPNIGRIKYVGYFAGQKIDTEPLEERKKPKQSWMDRLAGVQPSPTGKLKQMPYQLLSPYGMAVGPDGDLFVADAKVGAVF